MPHRWPHALKEAVGTAYEETGSASPVWFTIADGILSEIFYPTVDRPQVSDLQFLVTDGEKYFSEQKRDCVSTVTYSGEGMAVRITGREKSGKYQFEQWVVTDPAFPVVRIRTTYRWNKPGLRVFSLFKPAINNSGSKTMAQATPEGLIATQASKTKNTETAVLVSPSTWVASSAGYVGISDGWQDLSRNFKITFPWKQAGPGNVALIGELPVRQETESTVEIALAFGSDVTEALSYAKTSLAVSFDQIRNQYEQGWKNYGKRLEISSAFARKSARIIKMHEDKIHRGAIVASLSKPAVPDSEGTVDGTGGYHLIWPRDLYHAAMGLLAAGDLSTPRDVLRYYAKTQKSDGSWHQNFWTNGSPFWTGIQMDQVSFPILLAHQLASRKVLTLNSEHLAMVRKAVGFLLNKGPITGQDRWEEMGGFIPSTIAAEIAGLRAAANILGDPEISKVASRWQSQLESWTLVPQSSLGRSYYLRGSPTGNPGSFEQIDLANGAGRASAPDIIDGGFLDLVRMKVRDSKDPRILSTLGIYERESLGIATQSPSFPGARHYRRYNRDAYGPHRVGGYWPLLAGEKGHYSIAAGDLENARTQLWVLEQSSLPSGVIPEQIIFPIPGKSTPFNGAEVGVAVACPLVWAHAEDILLYRSIEEGSVFDAPRVDR